MAFITQIHKQKFIANLQYNDKTQFEKRKWQQAFQYGEDEQMNFWTLKMFQMKNSAAEITLEWKMQIFFVWQDENSFLETFMANQAVNVTSENMVRGRRSRREL